MLKRIPIFGVLVVLGVGYWVWDSTHHDDHPETHAAPVPIAVIEKDVLGEWQLEGDDGAAAIVTSASCKPGEGGDGQGPDVHFRCDLTLGDGTHAERVVHLVTAAGGYQLLMNEV